MAIIEKGKAVLADLNGTLQLVPQDQAAEAMQRFGWTEATEEDIRKDDLQKEKGGVVGQAEAALVSAGRPVASGIAAATRAVSDSEVRGQDIAPGLFNESANRAVEANPTAAAVGRAAPLVAGGLALAPVTGGASLAAVAGLDVLDAAAQAALDADLEGRDIRGTDILRNAGLNLAFSGMGHAIPVAAKALVRGAGDVAQRAASSVVGKLEDIGASRIAKRVEETIQSADEALDAVKAPKVINNPGGQRDAIETLAERFRKSNPDVSRELDGLMKGSGNTRYKGLTELRATLEEGSEAAQAIDKVLPRADLWGQKILDHVNDLNIAKSTRPPVGATPDLLSAYADTLRKFPGSKLAKQADLLDELAQTKALEPIATQVSEFAAKHVAGKTSRAAGAVAGGVVGGWPGAWIGQGVGELLAPSAETFAQSAVPAASRYLVQAGEALKRFAENDRMVTARLLVDPVAAGRFSRVLGDVPTAALRFQGNDETPQQAFDRWRNQLDTFRKDPNALIDVLNEEFDGIADKSPYLHRQLVDQAFKISGFLQDKLPKPRGVSVARPNGTPVSPLEMRTFALYATAALDPGSVLNDAKLGRLRREQVETLKALWPDEYQGLRDAVVQQLGNGRSTTATRQRMNLLFDFGSSIDPALGPAVSKIVNSARDAQAQGSGGSSRMTAASPPSVGAQMPAGAAALQLGPSLDK